MSAIGKVLDSVSAGNFKTDESGRTLYFPQGVLGGGYVVPDTSTEARLRSSLRRYYGVTFASLLVVIPIFNMLLDAGRYWAASGLAAVALTASYIGMRMLVSRGTAGLEKAAGRMTLGEAVTAQARSTPRWFSILQAAIFGLIALGGMLMIPDASSGSELALALGASAVGSALLAASIYGLVARAKS